MSEQVRDDGDDALPEVQPGELVQWMEPRPLSLGPTGIAVAVAAAFALGVATAALVTALTVRVRAERRMSAPLERRLRRWS